MEVHKLKICFVASSSIKRPNGITTFILDLSELLISKKIDVMVICPFGEKLMNINKRIENNMKEIKILNYPFFNFLTLLILQTWTLFKNRKQYDILHLQHTFQINGISSMMGKILGKKVITTIHGAPTRPLPVPRIVKMVKSLKQQNLLFITSYFNRIMEDITYQCSNEITYVCQSSKEVSPYKKGRVINNGVYLHRYKPVKAIRDKYREKLNIKPNDVVFIYSGSPIQLKGIDDLLEAFTKIDIKLRNNTKLVLISEMSNDPRILSLKSKGFDNVIVTGAVDRDDIINYYNIGDVFLLTSYWEGMSFSLLEAMACGLVPIVTNVGGNLEIVENEKNGFIIEPGAPDTLREKMEWCIENKNKLSEYSKLARITIDIKFDINNVCEKYITLYKETINAGN